MDRADVGANDALIVVDVQNDFLPGGALAVPGGDEIVSDVNRLMALFDTVVLTQDWHTQDHRSFASQHSGRDPFETVTMPYGEQVLWPDHCVGGSTGAAFAPGLEADRASAIIRKGANRHVDSYSAFFENDRRTPTGLAGYLRERNVARVFVCGLATDFCVAYSALDSRALGFPTTTLLDVSRAIDLNGSLAASLMRMREAGVELRGA